MPKAFIENTQVKKIYITDVPVKKVYIGDTLAWASIENMDLLISNQEIAWGSNYFATRVAVWVKQKNYADNQMTIQVQVNLKSKGGTISSSSARNGTVNVDSQGRTFSFTPSISANQDRQLVLYSDFVINNPSNRQIKINVWLPININLSGIGNVGNVDTNFYVTLPSL